MGSIHAKVIRASNFEVKKTSLLPEWTPTQRTTFICHVLVCMELSRLSIGSESRVSISELSFRHRF